MWRIYASITSVGAASGEGGRDDVMRHDPRFMAQRCINRYGGVIPPCGPLQRRRIGVTHPFYSLARDFFFFSIPEMTIYLFEA